MYGIVDCNSFYASCERAFRPELKDKPIVVLSNNDGCVIARSSEVKKLTSIPMGAVAFKNQEIFKKNHVHVFSSNYALYGDMSSRVMSIIGKYVEEVEPYSIDEAFFKLTNKTAEEAEIIGQNIQKEILRQLGLPVSVGIAKSKSLAKIANNIVKKFPKETNNVYVISTEEQRIKALKWTNIGDVWGIGKKISNQLQAMGITKAYGYTLLTDTLVRKRFSVVGLRLKHDLDGKATIGFDTDDSVCKKMIAITRSFAKPLIDLKEIEERIATFANCASEKLRKQNSECSAAYFFLESNRFKGEYIKISGMVAFGFSTSSSITITKRILEKLRDTYKKDVFYKKGGVILVSLSNSDHHQIQLFTDENPKHKLIMHTMDSLNAKMGKGKIKLANQDPSTTWKMRQEYLSPNYTTKMSDIITVNCNK